VGLFDRDMHWHSGSFLPAVWCGEHVFPEGKVHDKVLKANTISGMGIGKVRFL